MPRLSEYEAHAVPILLESHRRAALPLGPAVRPWPEEMTAPLVQPSPPPPQQLLIEQLRAQVSALTSLLHTGMAPAHLDGAAQANDAVALLMNRLDYLEAEVADLRSQVARLSVT